MKTWNEAGLAKYWTVAAPGNGIYGSKVNTSTGEAMWGNSSGTSMSAPHVAGAMGVLMSRYQDMTALQVRDVMFTTANHKNADGSNMEGWNNVDGTTPLEAKSPTAWAGAFPILKRAVYGPGQFLGKFDYNMANTKLDVWTNDITQVALDQRKREDMIWMEATSNGTDITAGATMSSVKISSLMMALKTPPTTSSIRLTLKSGVLSTMPSALLPFRKSLTTAFTTALSLSAAKVLSL